MDTKYKFSTDRISSRFVAQQNASKENKYILLYRAVKQCILETELPSGWLMPPTRVLAVALQLSRTTVLKAYELLTLEKLIKAKVGFGNVIIYNPEVFVKRKASAFKNKPSLISYPGFSEKGESYLQNSSLINRFSSEHLAFRPGLPPIDVFPINQWKKLLNTYWRYVKSSGLSYSQSTGVLELKKSICSYLNVSRNIKAKPQQIVIVSGSLQSLFLVTETLINKGDDVVVENPLFPNVHSIFKSNQANLIPVDLDEEGIAIQSLALENTTPKLIHVTPSNQYPLGIKMSLERRKEVLAWASKKGALIIENDYESEIANLNEAIPSIYSLDQEDRTIYMGTFNRLLHPSIRLGYMIVPAYLRDAVEALQEHSHRFVSPSIQVVMNQFIEKNYLYQHIKNCILTAEKRFQLFNDTFSEHVKGLFIEKKNFESFHVVAYFTKPTTTEEEGKFIKNLSKHGITVFPLSKCYIGEAKKTGLILGYSSVRPSVLVRKIKTFGNITNKP